MPEQIQTPDFQEILGGLDLGFADPSEFIDPFVNENRASAGRIRQARTQSERDPRNIVDKIAPFAELVGFLADRTSGDITRRRNALPMMSRTRQSRLDRVDRRENKRRRKYLDRLAEEEMLGAGRARNFNAQIGGVQSTNINKRATATAAGQVYGQKSASNRAGGVSFRDREAEVVSKLVQSGNAKLDGGVPFNELTHGEQQAVTGNGYRPFDLIGFLTEKDKNYRAEAMKVFAQAFKDAAGDPDELLRVRDQFEAHVSYLREIDLNRLDELRGKPTARKPGPDILLQSDPGMRLSHSPDLGSLGVGINKFGRRYIEYQRRKVISDMLGQLQEIPAAVSDR